MSGPFKMKGAGEVYYEGSGDPINLNPNDLGKEYIDEYGNKAYDHKKTKDVFYKNKPVLEPVHPDPIKQERSIA